MPFSRRQNEFPQQRHHNNTSSSNLETLTRLTARIDLTRATCPTTVPLLYYIRRWVKSSRGMSPAAHRIGLDLEFTLSPCGRQNKMQSPFLENVCPLSHHPGNPNEGSSAATTHLQPWPIFSLVSPLVFGTSNRNSMNRKNNRSSTTRVIRSQQRVAWSSPSCQHRTNVARSANLE